MSAESCITELIRAWLEGDAAALETLSRETMTTLKSIARRQLAGERPNHTLQPTALVNEAYLRLLGAERLSVNDRIHFFALMGRSMRNILRDYGRNRHAAKRGAGAPCVTLVEALDVGADRVDIDTVALDQALTRLSEVNARGVDVFVLRHFGGLTVKEVAAVLSVSEATVKNHWSMARLWLGRELYGT